VSRSGSVRRGLSHNSLSALSHSVVVGCHMQILILIFSYSLGLANLHIQATLVR
jgi:hypothetical protein